MNLFGKINIEIKARELALNLLNEHGLEGLSHYVKTLNTALLDSITYSEGNISKANETITDIQVPFESQP